MDLIAALSSQLGIDPNQAQGLAGTVLGHLGKQLPEDQAGALASAVPELGGWSAQASSGAGGGLGAMLGALGGDNAALLGQLAGLGVTPDKIGAALPMVIAFAKERLPGPVADQLVAALPGVLAQLGVKEEGAGGLLGGLGGLFR